MGHRLFRVKTHRDDVAKRANTNARHTRTIRTRLSYLQVFPQPRESTANIRAITSQALSNAKSESH